MTFSLYRLRKILLNKVFTKTAFNYFSPSPSLHLTTGILYLLADFSWQIVSETVETTYVWW